MSPEERLSPELLRGNPPIRTRTNPHCPTLAYPCPPRKSKTRNAHRALEEKNPVSGPKKSRLFSQLEPKSNDTKFNILSRKSDNSPDSRIVQFQRRPYGRSNGQTLSNASLDGDGLDFRRG